VTINRQNAATRTRRAVTKKFYSSRGEEVNDEVLRIQIRFRLRSGDDWNDN